MTLNLQSESQALFILKIFFLLTQAIIIIDVANLNVEENNTLFSRISDQVMIFLDAEVSLFESLTYMLFKSVTFFILITFAKSKIISSVSIINDHMKKYHLNSAKTLTQHQAIIVNIMISSLHSFSDHINIIVKNLLKTQCHAVLNEKIRSIYMNVKREERQHILLQIRMKVAEHEFSFVIFTEFQFIIKNMKVLQRQQNYLKMCTR